VTGGRVSIARAVRRAVASHAREAAPAECCGLLLGRGARVMFAARMTNVADRPDRYRLDDREHIALRKILRGVRPPLEIVGVYHSHPHGPAVPSATDRAEAQYPDWVHVIAGVRNGRVQLAAFRIRAGRVIRLPIS
jgi:proteasome lid subunit RPN8/RPN11